MNSIKIQLVDNDYVVRAKTELVLNGIDDLLGKFVRQINEELIVGEMAFLEIEGSYMKSVTLEVRRPE